MHLQSLLDSHSLNQGVFNVKARGFTLQMPLSSWVKYIPTLGLVIVILGQTHSNSWAESFVASQCQVQILPGCSEKDAQISHLATVQRCNTLGRGPSWANTSRTTLMFGDCSIFSAATSNFIIVPTECFACNSCFGDD